MAMASTLNAGDDAGTMSGVSSEVASLRRDLRKLLAQGTMLLSGQVAAAALAVVVAVVLARALGEEDYGRYVLVVATVIIVSQVIDVRVWEAATRFASDHLAYERRVEARAVLELAILLNLAGGLVAMAILAALAAPIADELLQEPDLTAAIVVYSAIAPMLALENATAAIFRIFDSFGRLGALFAGAALLRLISVGVVVAAGGGLSVILASLLIAETVAVAGFVATGLRMLGSSLPSDLTFLGRLGAIRGQFRIMGRFLAVSNLTSTLRILNERLDVVLVGALASPAAAGLLGLARTFVQPLVVLYRPFTDSIYPTLFSAAARGELNRARPLLDRMTRLAGTAMLLAAAVLSIASPWLIPAIAGEDFATAWEPLIPLAAGTAILGSLFWLQAAATAVGLRVRALGTIAIATGVQVAAVVALADPLEALAGGVAYALFAVVWASLLLPVVWSQLKEPASPAGSHSEGKTADEVPDDAARGYQG
jgi:O-antigen/teichoic acid export membrane protein